VQHFIPEGGGAEIHTLRLAMNLVKRGFQVTIVTGRYGKYSKIENIDGVLVRRLFIGSYIPILHVFLFLMSLMWYLVRNHHEYDVIQLSQVQLPALVAAIVAKPLGKKIVIRNSNAGVFGDIAKWDTVPAGRKLLNFVAATADAGVAVSVDTWDELVKAGFSQERMRMIPNGVEIPYGGQYDKVNLRNKLLLRESAFVIIFVGRLSSQKAPSILLDSWIEFAQYVPDTQLVFLGDGELRMMLEEQMAQHVLGKRVIFAGKVDNVNEYLMAADVFALSSVSEGMSNALLEAMAIGLPVVASQVSGTSDVIEHRQNGLLFNAGDIRGMTECLFELAQSTELRAELGASARWTIEEKYSLDKVTDNYLELYRDLMFR
jgi:glycosyltransferase involved in cell wall biosynthesis